tara:strand:+ start:408 stop:746 length:339 start_codon:yes stop_codon:yes gene_type:complete
MRKLFLLGFLASCGGPEEGFPYDTAAEIGWGWVCEHPDSPYVGKITAELIDDEPWEFVELVIIDSDDLFNVPMEEVYVSGELYGWEVEAHLYDLDCYDDEFDVFIAYSAGEG